MFALEAIISGTDYALVALLAGALITAGFLLPKAAPRALRAQLVRFALRALLLYIGFDCLWLLLQGAKLSGGGRAYPELLFAYVTATRGGKLWLSREMYALALALPALWVIRKTPSMNAARLLALGSLPLVVSRGLAGHAVAVKESAALALSADLLHLLATALWGGGLAAVSWVLYSAIEQPALVFSAAAETVRRFSSLALASVGLLFATGLYQSWIQAENVTILVGTAYGRVLILKLVVFAVAVGLGALNWRSTKPRLLRAGRENRADAPLARRALATIGTESGLALLIFFITGFLTTLPPGVHAWHEKEMAQIIARSAAGARDLAPAEGARVEIVSPKPGQTFSGDQVPLRFELTKGKRGDHVHAYIDGELMGMFTGRNGTLTGVDPGAHVLELRVVADDHRTELDATDRVEFRVE